MLKLFNLLLVLPFALTVGAQSITIDGRVLAVEEDRGLAHARVTVRAELEPKKILLATHTDSAGLFRFTLPKNQTFTITAEKESYQSTLQTIATQSPEDNRVHVAMHLSKNQAHLESTKVVNSNLNPVRDPGHVIAKQDFEEKALREKAVADVVGLTPKREPQEMVAVEQTLEQEKEREKISGAETGKVIKTDLKVVQDPGHRRVKRDFEEEAQRQKALSDFIGLTPDRKSTTEVDHRSVIEAPTKPLPPNFTGYAIELKRLRQALAANDPIFNRYGEIQLEELASGEYSYLLPGFSDFDQCVLYFEEKVEVLYPNAKIIEFLSGSRK